jgi:hypothetical protein
MTKERDPGELRSDLLEQADETRRLIARFSEESEAWRAKALLACLKNDNVLLEALAALLGRDAPSAPKEAPAPHAEPPPPPPSSAPAVPDFPHAHELYVEGPKAREIVEEFDNRDHTFDRGLEKLNSWAAGGKGALPFQKRDTHAYVNRSASSEAMIARVESELMGREGFGRRLGRLKVDGLDGDILVYERGT